MRAVNLIRSERSGPAAAFGARSQGGALAVLVLVAGLAVLGLLYGVARHHVSTSRSEYASLEAQLEAVRDHGDRLSPYTSFMSLHEERLQDIYALASSRFDWAHAMRELGRVLPASASISSLDGTVAAAAATTTTETAESTPSNPDPASSTGAVSSATPAGSVPTITLQGCAASQGDVAETLDRLRLIDGVHDVQLQSSTRNSASGGSGANCPTDSPYFSIVVTFDALPASSKEMSG